ncbi:PRD domain protein [Candidatus Izimaplasma bacterium HR1]|jgi:hypothetical protein|uniref:PRD domain-containing protein n=1 Tax=Candidatus Izimoplasma sp. HR1 TaxID=1541959 RepID=UPI0004F5C3A4|nr:PRD domain protein [Candidatus Izimaplasma bacterium HR1]
MKDQTKLKINILKDREVISETTVKNIYIIEETLTSFVANIEEMDTDSMFTHLAIALDRVEKNNQLTESNEIIKEQLMISGFYTEAEAILQKASQKANVVFNEAESIMVLVHICTLLLQRGE